MTSDDSKAERPSLLVPMLKSDFIAILALGAGTGFLLWALGGVLDRFVFDAYFCQGNVSSQCDGAKNYAAVAATFVGSFLAIAGLIRLRVFRPLLVLIASVVSTWGLLQLSWSLGWFTGLLSVVLLYALAFGLFSWVARIREFWVALVVMAVIVMAARIALMT